MEIQNKIKNTINSSSFNTSIILVSMLFIPLSELFGEVLYNIPFIFERSYLTFLGFSGLIVFSLNLITKKRFSLPEIAYVLLVILAAISVIFSNPTHFIPMFVASGHTEEIFHYFAYFFLFYSATKVNISKSTKFVIFSFIIIGLLHNFFGIFQLFGMRISDDSYNNKISHEELRCIYGLTSNCNFYAAIATLFTSISCITYFMKSTRTFSWRWMFLIFISIFCAICSGTRLGILGILSTIIFLTVITCIFTLFKGNNSFKKTSLITVNTNKFLVIIFIAVIATSVVYLSFPHLLLPSITEFSTDFDNMSSGKNIENIGSLRGQVWRFTFEYIANINYLTGTGIGNFIDVFFTNPKMHESPQIVNFAHNEYLHIFATQGVFAFILYIALYTTCIIKSIKTIIYSNSIWFKQAKIILLFILLCYMTQAFFNCNIFETYLYFWILLGLNYSSLGINQNSLPSDHI